MYVLGRSFIIQPEELWDAASRIMGKNLSDTNDTVECKTGYFCANNRQEQDRIFEPRCKPEQSEAWMTIF